MGRNQPMELDVTTQQIQFLEREHRLELLDRVHLLELVIGQRSLVFLRKDAGKVLDESHSPGFLVGRLPAGADAIAVFTAEAPRDYLLHHDGQLSLLEVKLLEGSPSSSALAAADITPSAPRPYGRPTLAEYWLVDQYSTRRMTEEKTLAEARWAELQRASPILAKEAAAAYESFINGWPE